MKTLNSLIGLYFLMSVGLFCQAQNPVKDKSKLTSESLRSSGFEQANEKAQSGGLADTKQLKGTSGSPYLFDVWNQGVITMKDKNVILGKMFRYNLYTQQMQFITGDDTLAIANPEEIENIEFGGKTFIFTSYKAQGKDGKGYFELISDGRCRILKRWVVLYHVVDDEIANKNTASGEESSFLRDCNCFLQFGDAPAVQASHNKKEFLSCFNEDKDRVSKFMKQNNIKMKSENDLKAVVDFYNLTHK